MAFVLILFVSQTNLLGQIIPNFDWTKKGSGSLKDIGNALTVDAVGNVYLTGEFFSTNLNFSPGLNITMAGGTGNCDFFLAKFDPLGNAIWGVKGGGTLTDRGYGVALDNEGKLLVTGHFYGTATFGTHTLTSLGNLDCFTAKFDTSGNIIWIKEGKSVSQTSSRGLATDNSGNTVVVGYFGTTAAPTVLFDPITLTSNGQRDVFVVKYNSSGTPLWGVNGGGVKSGDEAKDVAIDAAGNIYVTGIYTDTATFSGVTLNGKGGLDIFIAKYNPNGQLQWAKTAGGKGADEGSGIAVDNQGNVYISGYFDSSATFGTTNVVGFDDYDAYLAKYDNDGNFLWVRYGGGTGKDYMNSIEIDNSGNIMCVGNFTGTAQFGPNSLTSKGLDDIFFIKCSSNSDLLWIKQAGGSDADKGFALALDGGNNIIATGSFKVWTKFGQDSLVSLGAEDVFLTKLGTNPVPVEMISFTSSVVNNNVELLWSTATETNNYGFEIERSNDNITYTKIGFVNGSGTKTTETAYSFNDKGLEPGKYYYRLKQIDLDGSANYSSAIETEISAIKDFRLLQNYPNPFNPSTSISFELPQKSDIVLSVYSSIGEKVFEVKLNELQSGRHSVDFNSVGLTSGVYLYQLKAINESGSSIVGSKKMILIK